MNHHSTIQIKSMLIFVTLLFVSQLGVAQLPSHFQNVQYTDGYGKLKWRLSPQSLVPKLEGQTITDVKKPRPSESENRKRSYQTVTATQEIDGVHYENTYFFVDNKFYMVSIKSEGPNCLSKSSAFRIIDRLDSAYGAAVSYDFGTSYVTVKSWQNENVYIEFTYQDEFTYAGVRSDPSFELKIQSIRLAKLTKP